jgi:hypothetical protein
LLVVAAMILLSFTIVAPPVPISDLPADVLAKLASQNIDQRNLTPEQRLPFATLDLPTIDAAAAKALGVSATASANYPASLNLEKAQSSTVKGWVSVLGVRFDGVLGTISGHYYSSIIVWLQMPTLTPLFLVGMVEASPPPATPTPGPTLITPTPSASPVPSPSPSRKP